MPRLLALALALAAAAALAASSAEATTKPGVVYAIKVTLTDAKITIGHDRFAHSGLSRYPRGAVIRFEITNRGKRRYTFRVWDRYTQPMRPGGHDTILVNWNYRGVFPYWKAFRGKRTGPMGKIVVF